jgi:hypothetical protein
VSALITHRSREAGDDGLPFGHAVAQVDRPVGYLGGCLEGGHQPVGQVHRQRQQRPVVGRHRLAVVGGGGGGGSGGGGGGGVGVGVGVGACASERFRSARRSSLAAVGAPVGSGRRGRGGSGGGVEAEGGVGGEDVPREEPPQEANVGLEDAHVHVEVEAELGKSGVDELHGATEGRGVAQDGQRVQRVDEGHRGYLDQVERAPRAAERPELALREGVLQVALVGVVEHLHHRCFVRGPLLCAHRHPSPH